MPTTADDADGYTLQNEGGKLNIVLDVEDFSSSTQYVSGTSASNAIYSGKLRSYLRLGAVPSSISLKYEAMQMELDADPSRSAAEVAAKWFPSGDADGEDLASKVLTFVDDTRTRGGDSYRLSSAQRQAQTTLLHTLGGWRDHTDGNRITTTRGDKIEVIVGNYKQIVMGRRQWTDATPPADPTDAEAQAAWASDNSLHLESSGGITYHYDQVPGQIVDVSWEATDGIFKVKEETHKGHFVERYEGIKKEWIYGPEIRERTGSLAAYQDAVDQGYDLPSIDGSSTSLGVYEADDDFDKVTSGDNAEAHTTNVSWPPTNDYEGAGAGPDRTFAGYAPNVVTDTFANAKIEHTWARKIVDFTGSPDKAIPEIIEETYANTVTEDFWVNHWVDDTVVTGSHTTLIKDDNSGAGMVDKRYGEYQGICYGSATELWGLGLSGYYRRTNFAEVFTAGFESFRFGFAITSFGGVDAKVMALAVAFDIYVANVALDIMLGGKTSCRFGTRTSDTKGWIDKEFGLKRDRFGGWSTTGAPMNDD